MTRQGRPDPLDPAERTLADALARAMPPSGPPATLDATILAAARQAAADRAGGDGHAGEGAPAAAASPSSTPAGHRRRRRSPAWLRGGALAATVVLAIGVAWQLRPQLEVVRLPEASIATRAPAHSDEVSQAPASTPRTQVPAEPAPPAVAAVQESAPAPERAAPPPSGTTPMVAPAPATLPAPPPAPPAPPAPAPPPTRQALPPPSPAPAPEAAARMRSADISGGTQAIDSEATHDEDWLDQPLDDTPPASLDAPAVREAWLARIRELVASERYEEARASFVEFRRRHPGAAVPEDLRALLGEE